MEIIVLGREDIKKILELHKVIEGVRKVYCLKSEGKTVVWPSLEYHFEEEKAVMDIRSGYVKDENLHGAKMLNNFPLNIELGIPSFCGMLLVFDSKTGVPLGVMDAAYITSMRTGAAAALGVKALARKDSKNLLIVGSGLQSIYMLAATLIAMPQIEKVRIADPFKYENAVKFAENAIERLTNEFKIENLDKIEFCAVKDLSEALSDTDAVITITRATSPIIKKEWVKPGTHFSCIGADMIGKEEIDPEIFRDARIFADDIVQCISFGEMEIPYKMGIITRESIAGELGEVLSGKIEGRKTDDEITIFDATGLALLDLVTGKVAIDLAKEKGLGTIVEI